MKNNQRYDFIEYSKEKFLDLFELHTWQTRYLDRYLSELGAQIILREPKYFDRDYLAEFASFYSVSSKGYPNFCERLHFFSEKISRRNLITASGGGPRAVKRLQSAYLGFIVKRPIPAAPLGRTVLKWYPDKYADTTPRVSASTRKNFVHISGVELYVEGLAWQQQDSGVSACATISLWSMFQSSALDDYHAIPTTADITQAAHKKHSFGSRMFPSKGLHIQQVFDVINERNLVPLITEGDVKDAYGGTIGFSKDRFASTCAGFIRSGYPIMIVGRLITSSSGDIEHAICSVGFRSCSPSAGNPSIPNLAESNIEFLYVHDDNLGPNVRVVIDVTTKDVQFYSNGKTINFQVKVVSLRLKGPPPRYSMSHESSPIDGSYGRFEPTELIVAANNDIRTDLDTLHRAALRHTSNIEEIINHFAKLHGIRQFEFTVTSRFFRISDYLGSELENCLSGSTQESRKVLSAVRLRLSENVGPMSLHIAVVRIGLTDSTVLVDFLYDTTDSDRNYPIFAHVAYDNVAAATIQSLEKSKFDSYGVCVRAY